MQKKCQFCGQDLNKGKVFCSVACRNRASNEKKKAKRAMFTCLYCGKEFHRVPSAVAKGSVKYCSRPCADAYIKEHGRPDKKIASKVCKNCGGVFTIPESWVKKLNGKAGQYCSRDCFHDYSR